MPAAAAYAGAPPGDAPPMEARDVNAFFNQHHALADVNLTFPANTVTALIGPSGCGKSTFIRCLNRMHELVPLARMEGSVFLHGNDIYGRDADPVAIRRGVGMVFQRPNPFPTKSIADNIKAGPKFSRIKMDRDERNNLRREDAARRRALGRGQGAAQRARPAASRAASSSACASRGPSRWSPTCCSWTSPARRWTPSRPCASRS